MFPTPVHSFFSLKVFLTFLKVFFTFPARIFSTIRAIPPIHLYLMLEQVQNQYLMGQILSLVKIQMRLILLKIQMLRKKQWKKSRISKLNDL